MFRRNITEVVEDRVPNYHPNRVNQRRNNPSTDYEETDVEGLIDPSYNVDGPGQMTSAPISRGPQHLHSPTTVQNTPTPSSPQHLHEPVGVKKTEPQPTPEPTPEPVPDPPPTPKLTKDEKKEMAMLGSKHSYTKDDNLVPTNYKLDRALSNSYVSVFHNDNTGHTLVSYRGTELHRGISTAGIDLLDDLDILTGNFDQNTTRIKQLQRHLEDVMLKYGEDKDQYLLSGHSLGSSIASILSKKNNIESVGFNTGHGVGSLNLMSSLEYNLECSLFKKCRRHIEYLNIIDPISFTGLLDFSTTKRYYFDTEHIHSLQDILKN
jgi:hypothetical protein